MYVKGKIIGIARSCNYIAAAALIVMYLAMPATAFSNAVYGDSDGADSRVTHVSKVSTPCGDCPCSQSHGSDCCETTCCTCACHAPFPQNLRLQYAPMIVMATFIEPSGFFPQVYLSIFVPPQNRV